MNQYEKTQLEDPGAARQNVKQYRRESYSIFEKESLQYIFDQRFLYSAIYFIISNIFNTKLYGKSHFKNTIF